MALANHDDPAGNLQPGYVVDGKFEVIQAVASGGMGFIYQARRLEQAGRLELTRPETDERVALKVMRTHLSEDVTAIERFQREAWTVSQLDHPNTVKVFEYGASPDGLMYIAMEWLDGLNLSEIVRAHGPMKPSLAAWVGASVARALAEAHDKGIVHRDLKPENVMLQQRSETSRLVKVLDFGIAKIGEGNQVKAITQVGTICGTPEYMSPEQARGEKLDGRSDVYGLGCLLYAIVAGQVPFDGKQPLHILLGHLTKPFPPFPEGVPDALARIVARATRKGAAERYASAAEMARDLEDFVVDAARCDDQGLQRADGAELARVDHTIIAPLLELGLSPTGSLGAVDTGAFEHALSDDDDLDAPAQRLARAESIETPVPSDPNATFKVTPGDNPLLASAPTQLVAGAVSVDEVAAWQATLPYLPSGGGPAPHHPYPLPMPVGRSQTGLYLLLLTLVSALAVVLVVILLSL